MKNSEILPSAVKKTPNNTNIEKAFICRQTQTDGRTDRPTLNKQTRGRPSDRHFFSNNILDAK